jgi:hypothetical protein
MDQEYEVTFSKSTKGYNVYTNEEAGLNLYFPKKDFDDKGNPPEILEVTVKSK